MWEDLNFAALKIARGFRGMGACREGSRISGQLAAAKFSSTRPPVARALAPPSQPAAAIIVSGSPRRSAAQIISGPPELRAFVSTEQAANVNGSLNDRRGPGRRQCNPPRRPGSSSAAMRSGLD